MDSADTLDFKLIDPVAAGEEWAVDEAEDGIGMVNGIHEKVTEIYLNGVEIVDIFRSIERPYCLKEMEEDTDCVDLTADYGHLPPKYLLNELMDATVEGTYPHDCGVYSVCCGGCGVAGCWSVLFWVTEDDEYVYWSDFENEHTDWEYHLSYQFKKTEYQAALQKLKSFAEKEAERTAYSREKLQTSTTVAKRSNRHIPTS